MPSSAWEAATALQKAEQAATRAAKCSFSGDTQVVMDDGSTKPIEDVKPGDVVLAEDPVSGKRGGRTVSATWKHQDYMVDFQVDDGVVTATEDHPFWNATDHAWEGPKDFDPGDKVLTADGNLLVTRGLVDTSWTTGSAFNLTVDDLHTYFVVIADQSVLVHNTCPDVFVDDALRAKVDSQHRVGGRDVGPNQSTFDEGINLDDLARCANLVACTKRTDGSFVRDVNYGSIVGMEGSSGMPTTWFRVAQDPWGDTITMHPIAAP